MYPNVHCSTIYNSKKWEQPRCLSTDEWINKLWQINTIRYYLDKEKNAFESVLMRCMNLEPIIQSEVNQKEKDKYHILMYIYGFQRDGMDEYVCKEKQTQRTDLWTWREEREGEIYAESNMEIYITKCKVNSQWEFSLCLWKLKYELCINLEQWDGKGHSRGRGHRYTYG